MYVSISTQIEFESIFYFYFFMAKNMRQEILLIVKVINMISKIIIFLKNTNDGFLSSVTGYFICCRLDNVAAHHMLFSFIYSIFTTTPY